MRRCLFIFFLFFGSSRVKSQVIKMIWALLPVAFVIAVVRFWFARRLVCPGAKVKPKIEDILENPEKVKYDLADFDLPKVSGWTFKILIWLSYTRFGRYIISPILIKKSNLDRMKKVMIPESPTFYSTTPSLAPQKDHTLTNQAVLQKLIDEEVASENQHFHLPTVADYIRAFRSGRTTPTDVAEAILTAIANSDKADPPLRAVVQSNRSVVLAMASASTQRWKENKTLSMLDGVPVAIKEEIHCEPYEFRAGASYNPILSKGIPEASIVQKLKRAGAVIIGVTNMQEFGTGTLGSNPHPPHLTTRNPYNPQFYTGGSSSGSAASVAAGFCPIAIGADGGGSIRIPAATCGIVGLKPTFNLIDSFGGMPVQFSVGCVGPLASSILDTAVAMDIVSQETEGHKKLVSLEGLGECRVDGLKVGIFWDHFNHADKEIILKCKAALSRLQELGAELVDIFIPEMEDTRVSHTVSIGSEFASNLCMEVDHHFSELNLETHLLVGSSYSFSATEYVTAQKQRTRAIKTLEFLFKKVDVIATPATGCVAPRILPEATALGICDGKATGDLMRFSFLANMTGIPGLVVPVGYTASGLPIGLQLMGQWYQENVLLRAGWALEHSQAFPASKPQVFYDVISK